MPHTSAHRDGLDPGQLLSVRSLPDVRTGHVVVEVTGEVDTYTAPLLDACLRSQAGRRGVLEVVVDLRGVTFLGAVGVTALARAYRRCRMHGARLMIRTGGHRNVEHSLELTGLADVVAANRPMPSPAPHGRTACGPRRDQAPRATLSGAPPMVDVRISDGRRAAEVSCGEQTVEPSVADDRDGVRGRPGQVPDHRRSLTDLRLNRWGRP